MKNVVAALVELAAELEMPLNLGGGIARGDPLEEFKRGFANREQPWHTSEIVCDPDAYARLSAGIRRPPATGFFPALPRGAPEHGRRGRLLLRFAGVGPVGEAEGVDRLAPVFAPGRPAEGADRVDVIEPLYSLQPSRFVQVVAATA